MASTDVLVLNMEVSESTFEEDAQRVLKQICPKWNNEDVKFKRFTDGITNKLIGCYLAHDPDDMVLIRMNGDGSDIVVDRQEEQMNFTMLSAAGCAPPVYCTFHNGMAYGFFPGEPLDMDTVREPAIQRLIANEMVRLHAVKADYGAKFSGNPPSQYRQRMQKYLHAVPTHFEDPLKQKEFERIIPSKAELQKELDAVCHTLDSMGMNTVFSHNDLLLKNIIYNKTLKSIKYIDYEYAFYNYEAFDIGNHFAEYAGMDETDYNFYPGRDEQLKWIRHYLECKALSQGKEASSVREVDIERLYVQTNKCTCAAHLFWAVWALIQAAHSTIDFDYVKYSDVRLSEYFRRKKEFFPLQMPASP